jgi:hypothetical protein
MGTCHSRIKEYEYNAEKESDSYTGDMARKVVTAPDSSRHL